MTQTLTPIVTDIDGAELVFTTCQAGDLVPISTTMLTVVFVKNTDNSSHTVTFTSKADPWGITSSAHDVVLSVTNGTTKVFGVMLPNRWASATNTCALAYSATTGMKIAVVHVPLSSL